VADYLPQRRSIRLTGYDYRQAGAYFVTICAHGGRCLFGDIVDRQMRLNPIGEIVADEWARSAQIRREVALDDFVVMPNHMHGIVFIIDVGAGGARPRAASLGAFVRGFKAATTGRINAHRDRPNDPVWQRNYYDHIVRDDRDLDHIREYIANNPANWANDRENPSVTEFLKSLR
jgi:REP element-mobilizing transposase RayT